MPPAASPPPLTAARRAALTALLLAGGQGSRMGGVDKGLQPLHGEPLAPHVLRRLAPQAGACLISANRNPDVYLALGQPYSARVVGDATPGFAGPLAGLLAGLRAARTPLVLTAPCDTPYLPLDLAARLLAAREAQAAGIAVAVSVDADGTRHAQPTFALVSVALADDLEAALAAGERRVRAWYARHTAVEVPFHDERAFYNANSLQELTRLERE
ncbi:MAG: molybdenum cofactor guanylyltransferase MobA [Burkholderia sp.]